MPHTRLQKRIALEKLDVDNYDFYDFSFSSGHSWDVLQRLMQLIYASHLNRGKEADFWTARNEIVENIRHVVVAYERNTIENIVGFYMHNPFATDSSDKLANIYLFQSFVKRIGVGTMMLNHLFEQHEQVRVGCVLSSAEPFWSRMQDLHGPEKLLF